MGACSSHELNIATAKLMLHNGQLQEFKYPVKVSQVLQQTPNCFICEADDMNYYDYIPPIDGDEELQLDHLYFALPVSWLKTPLRPRQMAALAVKASLALKTAGSGRRNLTGIRRVNPLAYTSTKNMECSSDHDGSGGSHGGKGLVAKRKGRSGGRRRSKFSPNLSVIMEE